MYEIFNQKLAEFADDICRLRAAGKADDVPSLDLLRPSIDVLGAMDRTKPEQFFHEHVVQKYGAQIAARDEDMLLSNDYRDQAANVSLDVVEMVKRVWKNMDAAEKDAVWGHLNVLIMLSQKIRR